MTNELTPLEGQVLEVRSAEIQSHQEFIDSIDLRIRKLESMKRLIFKCTRPSDWVIMKDMQGNKTVYLEAGGAESLAAALGIGWDRPEITKTDLPENHYEYEFSGNMFLANRAVWVLGCRASNSPFFVGRNNKPAESINHGNVKKSAYTNWLNNGIKTLLGIKNITLEDLAANGIDTSKCRGLDFKASKSTNTISEAQRKRLYAIGKSQDYTDDQMKAYIKKEYKFESTAAITRDKYNDIIADFEAGKPGE